MDYQAIGAVGRLLAVSSMFVTVVSNIWRHGDIDLTGRYANMRTIYLRAIAIGVVLAVVARLNILAMLRTVPAFDSYLGFTGSDIADEVIGIIVTGTVTSATSASCQEIVNIMTTTKTTVSSEVRSWLIVCCSDWLTLSMSLVTRLSSSPRGCWSK